MNKKMETLNWLIDAILNQISEAFWAVAGQSFLFAAGGLALGILLVVIAGRNRVFKREFRLWSFIAGLNYVYIPLLLMVLGGALGGFRGAHLAASRFIDQASEPFVEYGYRYANHFKNYLPEIPWDQQQDRTIDEAIAYQLAQEGGLQEGSVAHSMASMFNLAIVNYTLDEMGVPEMARDPLSLARALQSTPVTESTFLALPNSLHQVCDQFFYAKYLFLLGLFLPFLLFPMAEFGLHLMARWLRRMSKGADGQADWSLV